MGRALVTGAAGFVGANLCRSLLGAGHEVHAMVRPGSADWRLTELGGDVRRYEASLTDGDAVAALVTGCRPRWIFHLAAHGAYSWQRDMTAILAVNAIGTAHLIDAALRADVESFVHAGSSSEYGFKDHAPDEREWIEPNSAYAVGKAAATQYARMVSLREDRHLVTLRLYSAYGPWEEPNRLMPALAVRGLQGELPPLADPRTARDYVHVADVCDAFIAAAMRPQLPRGSVYNLASGTQTTLETLVEIVRAELAITAEPKWGSLPSRTWDTDAWVGTPARIAAELGWRAARGVREGFRDLVAWMRDDPRRLERYAARLSSADRPGTSG